MPRWVGFVNWYLRVPLMYLPCCLWPSCQGRLGELSERIVCNLYLRGILSRSNTVNWSSTQGKRIVIWINSYTSVSWCKLLQVSTLQEGLLRLEYADEASEDSFGRETLPMPPLRPQVLPIRKFEPPHEDTRRHRRREREGCGRQLMVFKIPWK